jgi:hypothetical protein
MQQMIQAMKFVEAIEPEADAFSGGANSRVIDIQNYARVLFVIQLGNSTGGTAVITFTVEACDDATPTNSAACKFWYRKGTVDTFETLGATTFQGTPATGLVTTAGDQDCISLIEVSAAECRRIGRAQGTPWDATGVRLVAAETADDPLDAAVLAIAYNPRYAGETMPAGILA